LGNLKKTNEEDCSTVCEGDEKIMCGGGLKNSIFEASLNQYVDKEDGWITKTKFMVYV